MTNEESNFQDDLDPELERLFKPLADDAAPIDDDVFDRVLQNAGKAFAIFAYN